MRWWCPGPWPTPVEVARWRHTQRRVRAARRHTDRSYQLIWFCGAAACTPTLRVCTTTTTASTSSPALRDLHVFMSTAPHRHTLYYTYSPLSHPPPPLCFTKPLSDARRSLFSYFFLYYNNKVLLLLLFLNEIFFLLNNLFKTVAWRCALLLKLSRQSSKVFSKIYILYIRMRAVPFCEFIRARARIYRRVINIHYALSLCAGSLSWTRARGPRRVSISVWWWSLSACMCIFAFSRARCAMVGLSYIYMSSYIRVCRLEWSEKERSERERRQSAHCEAWSLSLSFSCAMELLYTL